MKNRILFSLMLTFGGIGIVSNAIYHNWRGLGWAIGATLAVIIIIIQDAQISTLKKLIDRLTKETK